MAGVHQPLPRGYRDRKIHEPPICARPGCLAGPADDSDLCPAHRDDKRRRQRESVAAARAKLRRRRLCAGGCGRKSARYRCPRCRIVVGRAPVGRVARGVDNSARIRKGEDGRTRYHGQGRRGRQTHANLDDQDLEDAIKMLEQARIAIAYAASPEVKSWGRIAQADAMRAALSKVALGIRLAEEPLERHRYHAELAAAAPRPK